MPAARPGPAEPSRNPDWLLAPGELLEAVRGHLRVVAYEDIADRGRDGRTALRQRLCAVRGHRLAGALRRGGRYRGA